MAVQSDNKMFNVLLLPFYYGRNLYLKISLPKGWNRQVWYCAGISVLILFFAEVVAIISQMVWMKSVFFLLDFIPPFSDCLPLMERKALPFYLQYFSEFVGEE